MFRENLIIDRENEVTEIEKIFLNSNLAVLTGRGGIGKTSVALKYFETNRLLFTIA